METTTTPSTSPTASSDDVSRRSLGRGTAYGLGLALAGNLAVFLLASIGSPLLVPAGSGSAADVVELPYLGVAVASAFWILIGTGVLWACERFTRSGWRNWTIAVSAVVVLTIVPVAFLDLDGGSRLALAAMHVVVGVAAVAGHLLARSRTRA